jgi:hypothetical protein
LLVRLTLPVADAGGRPGLEQEAMGKAVPQSSRGKRWERAMREDAEEETAGIFNRKRKDLK